MPACIPPPTPLVTVVQRAAQLVSARVTPLAVPDTCLASDVPAGSGMATPGTVWFARADAPLFSTPVRRWSADRVFVVLHEALHQVGMANGLEGGDQMEEEDGLTESVAQDLRAVWLRREIGRDVPVAIAYRDLVRRARLTSARAVGRPWTSPQARAWRITALATRPSERPPI